MFAQLLAQPTSFYYNRMKELPILWEKCIISKAGDYIEKLFVLVFPYCK